MIQRSPIQPGAEYSMMIQGEDVPVHVDDNDTEHLGSHMNDLLDAILNLSLQQNGTCTRLALHIRDHQSQALQKAATEHLNLPRTVETEDPPPADGHLKWISRPRSTAGVSCIIYSAKHGYYVQGGHINNYEGKWTTLTDEFREFSTFEEAREVHERWVREELLPKWAADDAAASSS